MEITEFLGSKRRNAWVYFGPMHLYARKSVRVVKRPEEALHSGVLLFDIANVNAPEETRGHGRFWELLLWLQKLLPSGYEGIYIESVLNERLAESLRKRGFQEVPTSPPSFVLWSEHD